MSEPEVRARIAAPEKDALGLAFAYVSAAWNTAHSLHYYIEDEMHQEDWEHLARFVVWALEEAEGYLFEIDPNMRERSFAMMDAGYVREMDEDE